MTSLSLRPVPRSSPTAIAVPGSKSYTNRALVMAALANGESTIIGPSFGDDSEALIHALKELGVRIDVRGDQVKVYGRGGYFHPFKGEINVGAAGTTMRFLASLCAGTPGGEILLSGSSRMHERPIADLVDALRVLGAEIAYTGKEGCPPLMITGQKLRGGRVPVKGRVSSQYISSLLLASPLYETGIRISVEGEQISKSYIEMTLASMGEFGLKVTNNAFHSYTVEAGSSYKPRTYRVEGDASGASYLWGIGALTGVPVRVTNVNPRSAQGDIKFPMLLKEMGCEVSVSTTEGWIEVSRSGPLKAIQCDMTLMPDTAQTLAVIATCAVGTTTITGLSTLKVKETDRLLALKIELEKLGIQSEITDDSIKVFGGSPHGGTISTYEDHRMAMAFAILASVIDGVVIENPNVVNKSFPEFWETTKKLGMAS